MNEITSLFKPRLLNLGMEQPEGTQAALPSKSGSRLRLASLGLALCFGWEGLHARVLGADAPPAPQVAPTPAAPMAPPRPPSKFRDFAEVTKDTEKYEGYFTLFKTNDILYGLIRGGQLNQPFLMPITIARGVESAGNPLNFGDEWVLMFQRDGDKILLVRRNIHYLVPEGTPLGKAVKQNYTDSVLLALPIVSLMGGDALVDFSMIFLNDFAGLRVGQFDRNRSSYFKIKAFPNNVEIQVQATYMRAPMGMNMFSTGDSGVADSRAVTLVIHYSLAKLPEPGYRPRFADNRVGHFLSANKDFASTNPDTQYVRQINRWRLEKADPKAKLSPPKKQLIWWVEDTVPHEFRPYVQEGILEWNKAFEKIGFRDAIGVRWQTDRDDFDPEDINYCTFRWITTSSTFAMSGLRANPLTGEMIDGDVIFDASWIRAFKQEYALLVGKPINADGHLVPVGVAEIISPILAAKQGYGSPIPLPIKPYNDWVLNQPDLKMIPDLVPASWSPLQMELSRRMNNHSHCATCQYVTGKQHEYSFAAMALAAEGKLDPEARLPEEFLAQAIKEVVMHEVGHSLGLRHNFKSSTMLDLDEINDTSITHSRGMVGSIMDYTPINIAPKGKKQGDYAPTTIGPYDYWAIEYAYKQVEGDEAAELKKIATRSPEHDLAYSTDEDMVMNEDPYVNTYDLGADPLKYGQQRVAMAESLLKNLDETIIKDGESWARLRSAFSVMLYQYGNAAGLASGYIGGQVVLRDFKGKEGRDPVTPIAGDKQREALKFMVNKILKGDAYEFPPRLLRRLTAEHWYHWGEEGMYGTVDFPLFERILRMQQIVLERCLDGGVLGRIQNQQLQSEPGSNPIKISEIFQSLTDGIWPETAASDEKAVPATIRRNLQRDYLQRLCSMVLGGRRSAGISFSYAMVVSSSGSAPADAKNLARVQLGDIATRIQHQLDNDQAGLDKVVVAHLKDCQLQIDKVLKASYTISN